MSEVANTWVNRFGVLEDVIVRKTVNGKLYCTFTLACSGFTQSGAAFGEEIVTKLNTLKNQRIKLFGVLENRVLGGNAGGRTVRSFKATKITS